MLFVLKALVVIKLVILLLFLGKILLKLIVLERFSCKLLFKRKLIVLCNLFSPKAAANEDVADQEAEPNN